MRYDRQTPYHYAAPIGKLPPLDSWAKLVDLTKQGHPETVKERISRERRTAILRLHSTCAGLWPIRGFSVPSRFAIPGGTNRVGAPTALRRMCSAQSGSLLFGLWLFSLPPFLYLNDDRKSSPNAVWFSAAPINKAPSDPTGGRELKKKRQGLHYLPICSFSLGVLWSQLCLCSESSGLGKWGRDLSACPHLWSTVNYL